MSTTPREARRRARRAAQTTWIDDRARPGGIGRSARERIFWERVASGRRREAAREAASRPATPGGAWESAEVALVTLLSVVIFGLGWVTVELEGLGGAAEASGSRWASAEHGARGEPRASLSLAGTDRSELNSWTETQERERVER